LPSRLICDLPLLNQYFICSLVARMRVELILQE
jgi:hypothetical protein